MMPLLPNPNATSANVEQRRGYYFTFNSRLVRPGA